MTATETTVEVPAWLYWLDRIPLLPVLAAFVTAALLARRIATEPPWPRPQASGQSPWRAMMRWLPVVILLSCYVVLAPFTWPLLVAHFGRPTYYRVGGDQFDFAGLYFFPMLDRLTLGLVRGLGYGTLVGVIAGVAIRRRTRVENSRYMAEPST